MKTIILFFLLVSINFAQSKLIHLFSETTDDRLNVNNLLMNTGAKNTTDFVQTAAFGDPDDMTLNANFSITTEGSNRWLRVVRLGGVNDYVGIQGINSSGGIVAGHTYNIRIKIRGNGGALRLIPFGTAVQTLPVITDVTIWLATPVVAADASFYFSFNGESDTSKWFEIDYIEVY